MTPDSPTRPAPTSWGGAGAALLALALAASIWPWLPGLTLAPESLDGVFWMVRGDPERPGWLEWIFTSRHFVGYRPLAAASYSAVEAVFGPTPGSQRGLNLLLHTSNVALVVLLARRLAPGHPAWIAACAGLIFALHPVAESVVPWVARRSMPLATTFGLAALWVFDTSLPREAAQRVSSGRSLLAALLLGASLLSFEVAYGLAAWLPALAIWRVGPRPDRWRVVCGALLAPAIAGALALVTRSWVIGGIGGYAEAANRAATPGEVALSAGRDLFALSAASGTWGTALLLACCVWLAVRAVAMPLAGSDRQEKLLALLAGWLVGWVALLSITGVWFPREAYMLVAPLALLLALSIGGDLTAPVERAHRILRLAPALLLLLAIAWQSPALRGPDPRRLESWRLADETVGIAERALASAPTPATVLLAFSYRPGDPPSTALRARTGRPGPPRNARAVTAWLRARHESRGIALETLALWPEATGEIAGVRTEVRRDAVALLVAPGQPVFTSQPWIERTEMPNGGARLEIDRAAMPVDGDAFLFVRSGGESQWLPLPAP